MKKTKTETKTKKKEQDKKDLKGLMNPTSKYNQEHKMFDESVLLEKEEETYVNGNPSERPQGIWPLDNDLVIEEADYDSNDLYVKIKNISLEGVDIIEMGVKYNPDESIEFVNTNINLPVGEKTVKVSCPRGIPVKFVLRTSRFTGVGTSRDFLDW